MTEITQTISTFTNPINRDSQTSAEIATAGDTTIEEWPVITGQMNTMAGQMNTVSGEVNSDAASSLSSKNDAEAAQTAAETAQAAAESASNATAYDTGQIGGYAYGDVVYYTDGYSYRCKITQAEGAVQAVSNTTYWTKLGYNYVAVTNDIGVPGGPGFGVGICPFGFLPSGMSLLPGVETVGHDNYGNYQFSDGSIMCYVPRHFVLWGNGSNGFAINVPDVMPWDYFNSEAEGNAAGYFIPRCFMDGGVLQLGIFVDKYKCSKRAWGTGYVASSIAAGLPLSTASTHNPIADLTACAGNYYYEAITAAHARDGVNGAVNADSIFFVKSQFVQSMLATLSMAHAAASSSTTNCAWYDATYNFPKGCNDNALGDTDDGTVSFTSDGYSNCGKTGSGVPFAKTTHNGQACGIADLNGLMYEVNIGVTCIASTKTITAATQANPCQLTVVGHGRATGDYSQITGIVGMTEPNNKIYTITVVDVDNFTLDGVDSTGFAAYTSGGSAIVCDFYTAKESISMKDFTSGNSGATDHWGAVGVAAMMDKFDMIFETEYPNNGFAQRMGSGANQVLDESVDGNGAVLTSLGVPKDADGVDVTGTNLFGKDYFYQYIRNELCVLSAGRWSNGSYAGVWHSYWSVARSDSASSVGFRCACYPV